MEWTPNQVVAYNLQRIRLAKDMTQDQACQETAAYLPGGGWSRAVWSAAERSTAGSRIRNFDADTITALAAGFRVPVSWFFLPPSPEEVPLDLVRGDDASRGMSVAEALEQVLNSDSVMADRIADIASGLGATLDEAAMPELADRASAREIDLARDHLQKALDLMDGSIRTNH